MEEVLHAFLIRFFPGSEAAQGAHSLLFLCLRPGAAAYTGMT